MGVTRQDMGEGAMGCRSNTHNAFRFATGSLSGESISRAVRAAALYADYLMLDAVCQAFLSGFPQPNRCWTDTKRGGPNWFGIIL